MPRSIKMPSIEAVELRLSCCRASGRCENRPHSGFSRSPNSLYTMREHPIHSYGFGRMHRNDKGERHTCISTNPGSEKTDASRSRATTVEPSSAILK